MLAAVGRDDLVDRVAGAALGGASVLLSGSAGIGKSTVLAGVVWRLSEAGVRVLKCAPAQEDARLPFVALIDVFSEVGQEEFTGLGESVRRAVDAALLRGDGAAESPEPLAVRLGVLQVLRGLAEQERVAVVVDDLQWVDASSLEVLAFAGRRLSGARVSVVATVRAMEEEAAEFLRVLPEGAVQESVGSLGEEVLIPLVVQRAGGAVPRVVAQEVCRATGGNPLFALEIAAALARRRALPVAGQPLPVPVELSRLIGERLTGLSPSARDALLVSSAVARPTMSLLEDAGCAAVMQALGDVEAAGVARMGVDGVVVFNHPLMRSVVYGGASLPERMGVHKRLATVVEDPVERAWHMALGSAVEDRAVAAELAEAAQVARSRGAAGMAGELARLAAERTPRVDVDTRAERLLMAAEYYLADDERLDEVHRAIEEALGLHPSRTMRAQIMILKMQTAMTSSGLVEAIDAAAADAKGVPKLESKVAVFSGWRYMGLGQWDLGARESRRAVEAAEKSDDLPTLIDSLDALLVSLRVTASDDYEPTMERTLRLVGRYSGSDGWRVYRIKARHLAGLRRFDEARAAVREALRMAHDEAGLGPPANCLYATIAIEITAGDYPAVMRAARELDKLVPDEIANGATLSALAQAEFAGGSVRRGLEFANRGLAVAERRYHRGDMMLTGYLVGVGHLMAGDLEAAIASLQAARELNLSFSPPHVSGYPWAPELAEALLLTGDVAAARGILAEGAAAARTRKAHEIRDVQELRDDIERVNALIKAAEGHLDEAAGQLEGLIERSADRAPIEIARAQVALVGVERRRRRRGAARALLADARHRCERSGALPWLALIDEEHARLDTGYRAGENALTPTEARIVGMVVEGATNREIAGALAISVKTVEATLSRIYRKTGAHSRIDLIKSRAAS